MLFGTEVGGQYTSSTHCVRWCIVKTLLQQQEKTHIKNHQHIEYLHITIIFKLSIHQKPIFNPIAIKSSNHISTSPDSYRDYQHIKHHFQSDSYQISKFSNLQINLFIITSAHRKISTSAHTIIYLFLCAINHEA